MREIWLCFHFNTLIQLSAFQNQALEIFYINIFLFHSLFFLINASPNHKYQILYSFIFWILILSDFYVLLFVYNL